MLALYSTIVFYSHRQQKLASKGKTLRRRAYDSIVTVNKLPADAVRHAGGILLFQSGSDVMGIHQQTLIQVARVREAPCRYMMKCMVVPLKMKVFVLLHLLSLIK